MVIFSVLLTIVIALLETQIVIHAKKQIFKEEIFIILLVYY